MSELLQLPATLTKISTMSNGAIRIVADSQEGVAPTVIAEVMKNFEKLGWLCFLVEQIIKPEDVKDLPEIKEEGDEKTPSQRLRSRLYVYYKETHTETDGFNEWYAKTLDGIGQKFLDKLNT